jgi:hypothetical protein
MHDHLQTSATATTALNMFASASCLCIATTCKSTSTGGEFADLHKDRHVLHHLQTSATAPTAVNMSASASCLCIATTCKLTRIGGKNAAVQMCAKTV